MCDKEQYSTEGEARKAARGVSQHRKKGSMRHYWCDLCEVWHIETEGKKPKRRRNSKKYPYRYMTKFRRNKHGKRRKKG